MWNLIVKALKDALKEKVTEMTKEEVKEWLAKAMTVMGELWTKPYAA